MCVCVLGELLVELLDQCLDEDTQWVCSMGYDVGVVAGHLFGQVIG